MRFSINRKEGGQAIFPLILVLTLVLGLIGVTFAGIGYIQSLLAGQSAFAEQARQAAASGVNDALLRIVRDRTWTNAGGYTVTTNSVNTTVTVLDSSTTVSRYRDEVLAGAPIGYWRLGESSGSIANDETVSARNGTYTNGVVVGQSGALSGDGNTAALFDGIDDFVTMGSQNPNLNGDAAFTVEAWVKPIATRNDGMIFSYGACAQNHVIGLGSNVSGQIYSVHCGNDHPFTATWILGQWQHVALTYDPVSSSESLYINGVFQESWAPLNLALQNGDLMYIGRSTWNGTYMAQGTVDEVVLYPTALSQGRITAHYQAGAAAKVTVLRTITATSTVRTTTRGLRVVAELTSGGDVVIRSREELQE